MDSPRTRTGSCRDLRHADGATQWTCWRGGELLAELTLPMAGEHNALNATAAAALAAGQGIAGGGDRGGARELQEREAAAGGAGRGARRDDHRRLRASSDGDPGDAARAAGGVSGGAAVGGAGAAVEHAAAECLRARAGGEPGAGGSRWCWPAVFKSGERFRRRSGCIRRRWSARWWSSGATPCWPRTRRRLSMHVAMGAQPGDVVAILSNGGFGGIYEKLPARLAGQPAVSSLK